MVIKTFLGVKILDKEVYIKYVEGDPGVSQIFEKIFCSPGNHRPKFFIAL